ncbi:hypothetical protein FJ987_19825 [Mesorhizobium sp. CU2]|nr:hypothetical protein FJ988_04830 [Mesorhizobium sp. CU3]TPO10908.1 hypothetical protein FJ987_19825 [Mesorhizobium sp. CU2]
MRGAGWIRGLREAEAVQLRREIGRLERNMLDAANSKAKRNLHDAAHALRWQKARLRRLEECLAAMPAAKIASDEP